MENLDLLIPLRWARCLSFRSWALGTPQGNCMWMRHSSRWAPCPQMQVGWGPQGMREGCLMLWPVQSMVVLETLRTTAWPPGMRAVRCTVSPPSLSSMGVTIEREKLETRHELMDNVARNPQCMGCAMVAQEAATTHLVWLVAVAGRMERQQACIKGCLQTHQQCSNGSQ